MDDEVNCCKSKRNCPDLLERYEGLGRGEEQRLLYEMGGFYSGGGKYVCVSVFVGVFVSVLLYFQPCAEKPDFFGP